MSDKSFEFTSSKDSRGSSVTDDKGDFYTDIELAAIFNKDSTTLARKFRSPHQRDSAISTRPSSLILIQRQLKVLKEKVANSHKNEAKPQPSSGTVTPRTSQLELSELEHLYNPPIISDSGKALENKRSWMELETPRESRFMSNPNRWGRPPSVPSIIHRKSQILCAGMGRLQSSLFVVNVLYTTLALAAFITTILTYNDILPASAVFKAAFPSLWALIASTTFLLLPSGPLTFFSLFASSKRAYSVTLAFSTIALVLVLATSITSYTFSKDSQVSSTLSDGWTVWNESGLRAMVEEKWSCCGYTDYSDRPGSDACVALGSGSNSSVTGSLDDPLSTDGLESIAATLVSQYQSAGTTSSASPSVKTNIASRSSAVASSVALTEALETSDWTVTEYEDSTESVMESNGAEAVFSTESVLPDTSPKVSTKPLPIIKTATNPQSLRVAQPIPQQRDFETTVQVKLTNQGCQDPLKSYIIKVLDRVYIAGFSFLALSCLHIVAMVAVQLDSGM